MTADPLLSPPPWRGPASRIFVVLPAYNEEHDLGPLLERIDEVLFHAGMNYLVILVDDGSQDKTIEIAQSYSRYMPILVERHEKNMGLGATIRDGLKTAAEMCSPCDIVVAMDADNTHTPGLIQHMVRMIAEGNDVVIASRYQPGAQVRGVPWHRAMLSFGMSWLFRLVFPLRGVRDYSCGFRAYQGKVLKQAFEQYGQDFINQEGFQAMVDILLKLRAMNFTFTEVPLVLRYDFKTGNSKMNVTRTLFNTLKLLLHRRMGY